jgi:ketosteroid isomerase-like protein
VSGPGSDERLAVASLLLDAFNRRSIEEARKLCDPDVELLTLFGRVKGAQRQGHDGLRDWFEHVREAWAFFNASTTSFEVNGDWVVADGRSRGRGKGSAAEVEFDWTAVVRVDDGKVVRLGIYLDRNEALRAIGMG